MTLDPARRRVLEAIADSADAAPAEGPAGVLLSEIVGVIGGHPNTARHHLRRLVADGLVASGRDEPHGRGRPGLRFRITPAGRDALRSGPGAAAGHFLALAGAFAERLSEGSDPRGQSRAVGRSWGESIVSADTAALARRPAGQSPSDAVDQVADLLGRLGFAPEPRPRPGSLALTQCPLLDAARRHPDVVCEVHAGLVEAILAAYGGSPGPVTLEAFARPGACILQMPRGATPGEPGR